MVIKDGDWRLVSHDEKLGRTVWSLYDGEKTVYRVDYRTDEIVKSNREARNAAPAGWKGDWHLIGRVPLNVYHDSGLSEAIGQRDDRFIGKFLTENDAWRTKDGRI